jgi:hypothetical protein
VVVVDQVHQEQEQVAVVMVEFIQAHNLQLVQQTQVAVAVVE